MFNLFDFSSLGGVSSIVKKPTSEPTPSYDYKTASSPFTNKNAPTQTGALSGQGVTRQTVAPLQINQGVTPPVTSSMAGRKNISKGSMIDSILPKANAGGNIIQKYLDDPSQDLNTKKEIMKAIENGDEDSIVQSLTEGGYKGATEVPKEELSTSRAIGEGIIGAVRAGEQIPRMLGNIGKFTGDVMAAPYEASKALFGEEAGLTSFLAPGAKQMQRAGGEAQAFGEEVTRAGMTDGGTNQLTEEQIKARKMGGDIALTSVLPVGQISKAKTALEALKTGAKVGAISTPQFTVATEGRLPTLGEQALGTVGGAVLSPALYGAGKLLTKSAPSIAGKVATEGVDEASKLGFKTEKGIIGGQEVNITRPKSGIIETVTSPLRSQDTKVLVGRALTPSYAGKTPKQIVQSATKTEANATKLHELVRTGKFEGNIDTLQDTAETIVKNIDSVGERIGKAIGTLKGKESLSMGTRAEMARALKSKVEVDAGAYGPLQKFWNRTKGETNYGDLFKIKKIYSSEIKKLIKSGDAGTDSFSALVKGVQEISDKLDNAVEKKLVGTQYADDKQYYKLLKEMVADVAKSSAVEGRRAPQTLIEQLGYLDALTSPVQAAKQMFARELGEMNTRSGTWKQFVKILDDRAVQNAKSPTITKPSIIPKPTTPKVVEGKIVPKEIPKGYIRNTFTGKIEKINQSKKGSLNIGQIGKDLGLVKKETIKNVDTSFGKFNSGRLDHKNGSLDYEIVGKTMDIDVVKVTDKQKGTGTELMKEAEKIAREKGLSKIQLSAQPLDSSIGQKELNAFYEKNGYINKGDNLFVKEIKQSTQPIKSPIEKVPDELKPFANKLELERFSEMTEQGKVNTIKRIQQRKDFDLEGSANTIKSDIEKQVKEKSIDSIAKNKEWLDAVASSNYFKAFKKNHEQYRDMEYDYRGDPAKVISVTKGLSKDSNGYLKIHVTPLGGKPYNITLKNKEIADIKRIGVIKSRLVNGKNQDYYVNPFTKGETPINYFKPKK